MRTDEDSDRVTLSASVSPASAGAITPTGTVKFSINGVSAGSSALDPSAVATLKVRLDSAPDTYTVTADFTSTNTNFGSSSAASPLVVTQEDARATYDGTTFTTTPGTIYVPLHATIRDISAVAGSGDTNPGDLHNARVSFINRDTNEPIATGLPITFAGTDSTVGVVDFRWPVTINASPSKQSDGSNGKSFTVATVVSGYYARNATYDDALVMVAEPAIHIVSGGGYLLVGTPAGADAGSRLNFSFNVTYDRGDTVTGGFINLLARSNGRVLQFRGTPSAIAGPPASGRTTVTGSGNVVDVTDRAHPIAIGAAQVQLDISDRNNSSSMLGVTLSQSGSLMLSSNWRSSATQQQTIDNGGVQVH